MKLHEKAEEHFNTKAEEFLFQLKPDSQKRGEERKTESSSSHVFITAHLSEKDIAGFTCVGSVNAFGQQMARYFLVGNTSVGLDGEAYARFEEFVGALHKDREINSVLSLGFVKDRAFEWFEKQYKGEIPRDANFVGFLTDEAQKSIKNFRVSIPISFISIQQPFKVGNVIFEYFKSTFFDEYIANLRTRFEALPDFDENDFKMFEIRRRKRYQGVVFASMNVMAEKSKAVEIVKAETEKALMILRFFSHAAFFPQIPCYFGIMGRTHLPENFDFVFEDHFPEIREGIDEQRTYTWSVTDVEISKLREVGLDQASQLITKEKLSELEELLINSISLFSRAVTSNDFQNKIVYTLVSAETLLLQNESEPVQSSLWIRLAFLTRSDVEGRRKTKELVRKAYRIRSSYIHHGISNNDMTLLQELQHSVWDAMRNVLLLRHKFTTQRDLLEHLEELFLS
jgi:hypothetical protein